MIYNAFLALSLIVRLRGVRIIYGAMPSFVVMMDINFQEKCPEKITFLILRFTVLYYKCNKSFGQNVGLLLFISRVER